MIPSSAQLARAVVEQTQNNPEQIGAIVSSLGAFLKEFHLEHLTSEIKRHIAHLLQIESRSRGCQITTAFELTEKTKSTLLSSLGMTPEDAYTIGIDPSLIGGCTVTHHGVLYDASLKTSLERLRLTLQD